MRDLQTEREVLTETIRQQAEAIRLGTAKQGAQQKDIDLYMAGLSAAQAEVEALTAEVERRKPDALALSDALVEIKTLSTEIQKRNATIYFAELELAKQKEEIDARSAEAYRDGKVGALENKCAQLKTDVDGQKECAPLTSPLRSHLLTA
jgi:broad specificity phosphatase PhoE